MISAIDIRDMQPDEPEDAPGYCPACNGSGEGMTDGSTCGTCKGKGEVYEQA